VAILDFEEACYYYRLFDLGMCAVGCCSKNGKFDLAKIKALMTGYTSRQPLMPEELRQLSIFVEYAAVAASLWRFRQYNINYPDSGKADSYLELSSLADQTATLDTLSSNN
jgi:homoserine kinase type II